MSGISGSARQRDFTIPRLVRTNMSEKWAEAARSAATAVKRGAETAANGVHAVTSYVARRDDRPA